NTFRDHLILEYEIPKYDGDLATPNFYVPLRAEHVRTKLDLLSQHFESQQLKHWYERETFLGLMRIRGTECHVAGHAEGFHCRKAGRPGAGDPAPCQSRAVPPRPGAPPPPPPSPPVAPAATPANTPPPSAHAVDATAAVRPGPARPGRRPSPSARVPR